MGDWEEALDAGLAGPIVGDTRTASARVSVIRTVVPEVTGPYH